MQNLFNSLKEPENAIILGLVISIVILLLVIFILDIKSKISKEYDDEELLDIDLNNSDIVTDTNDSVKEIKYVDEREELEKTKAKIELENLKAELKKEKEMELIEEINNIDPSLTEDNKNIVNDNLVSNTTESDNNINNIEEKNSNSNITTMQNIIDKTFNDEEENAIISVSELEKKADSLYNSEEVRVHEDEGNEPISIVELEALYKDLDNKNKKEDINEPIKVEIKPTIKMDEDFKMQEDINETNHFSSTPFISPIYGIDDNSQNNSLDNVNLEQTANLDKLNEELKKVNEFLSMLKELRNKLQ